MQKHSLDIIYSNRSYWYCIAARTAPVSPAKEIDLKKVENGVSSAISAEEYRDLAGLSTRENSVVSITVIGASGDLAKKKIFPALFALYYEDCLPEV